MILTHTRRWTVVALAAALLAVSTPAFASQDPGTLNAPTAPNSSYCPLTRIGTQFVRCDNLTGNGVPAPSWVPES
jgi:hypothetical protein